MKVFISNCCILYYNSISYLHGKNLITMRLSTNSKNYKIQNEIFIK